MKAISILNEVRLEIAALVHIELPHEVEGCDVIDIANVSFNSAQALGNSDIRKFIAFL